MNQRMETKKARCSWAAHRQGLRLGLIKRNGQGHVLTRIEPNVPDENGEYAQRQSGRREG